MSQQPSWPWRVLLGLTWTVLAVGFGPPALASVRVESNTIVRFLERQERESGRSEDHHVIPAYEYLQVDADGLGLGGLSFHGYGWGRAAMGGDYFDERTQGEVLYGYLEYRHEETGISARLGRQAVFAGTSNESLDGLRFTAGVTPYLTVDLYGGYPVALEEVDGRGGDRLFGGRLGHHLGPLYDLGLSYKKVVNDGDRAQEDVGIDSHLQLPWVSLSGFSTRNLVTDGWKEHSYTALTGLASFSLQASFQRFQFADYFDAGAKTPLTFRFLKDTDETVTVIGGEGQWAPAPLFDFRAVFRRYDYDERDETARYGAAGATLHVKQRTTVGADIGVMDGDSADNRFKLLRGSFYSDHDLGFVSGDAIWVKYDEEILGEDRALFASLGVGTRFWEDALELKISGDASSDPYFDKDFRGFVAVTYVFAR